MAGNCLRNCDPLVKALCNKAMACGYTKCHRGKKVSNMMGSQINIFLSLISGGTYGVDSRDGTTMEPNAVENDKEYMVCATTKTRIELAVAQSPRKRKSQLSQAASTATTDMNTATCLKRLNVSFAVDDGNNDTVEVHTVFDDDVEEEREIKSRVGYCTNFPL